MSVPIRRSLRLACSVEHAFRVFTSRIDMWWPPGHRQLPGSTIRMEARVGGRFFEESKHGAEKNLGEVLRWEPPNRLSYSWFPGSNVGATEVDIYFSAGGDHTLVEVTHGPGNTGLGAAWPEHAQKYVKAWAAVLPAFEQFLNRQPEAPS